MDEQDPGAGSEANVRSDQLDVSGDIVGRDKTIIQRIQTSPAIIAAIVLVSVVIGAAIVLLARSSDTTKEIEQPTGVVLVGAVPEEPSAAIAEVLPSATLVPTITPSPTPTPTNTHTPTITPSPTPTPTITMTPTPTAPDIGSTSVSEKDGSVMAFVPAGEFLMGSADSDSLAASDEKPQHTVRLDAFWIDRTEVTNRLYALCVSAGACQPPSSTSSFTLSSYYDEPQFANYPVLYVSWNDAREYCLWAERRLPTEAEWGKAARGTDGRVFPWGSPNVGDFLLNFCDMNCQFEWSTPSINDGYFDTAPVASYINGVSPYGAFDMAGNVWEWVNDWYSEDYYSESPSANPSGPPAGSSRVTRGGGWRSDPTLARAARRNQNSPTDSYAVTGFRCASSY